MLLLRPRPPASFQIPGSGVPASPRPAPAPPPFSPHPRLQWQVEELSGQAKGLTAAVAERDAQLAQHAGGRWAGWSAQGGGLLEQRVCVLVTVCACAWEEARTAATSTLLTLHYACPLAHLPRLEASLPNWYTHPPTPPPPPTGLTRRPIPPPPPPPAPRPRVRPGCGRGRAPQAGAAGC